MFVFNLYYIFRLFAELHNRVTDGTKPELTDRVVANRMEQAADKKLFSEIASNNSHLLHNRIVVNKNRTSSRKATKFNPSVAKTTKSAKTSFSFFFYFTVIPEIFFFLKASILSQKVLSQIF